jgi:hypothetical protein
VTTVTTKKLIKMDAAKYKYDLCTGNPPGILIIKQWHTKKAVAMR